MRTRPCGHPKVVFEDVDLRCGCHGCPHPPRSTIVNVSPGLGSRPGWVITGACAEHEDLLRDTARLGYPEFEHEYAEPLICAPGIDAVLDWIHEDTSRCDLDYFSVSAPGSHSR
ncbi:MAG: hypothetical protein GY926_04145 [bacterium]|nr:hypothetical protein [bacterium]